MQSKAAIEAQETASAFELLMLCPPAYILLRAMRGSERGLTRTRRQCTHAITEAKSNKVSSTRSPTEQDFAKITSPGPKTRQPVESQVSGEAEGRMKIAVASQNSSSRAHSTLPRLYFKTTPLHPSKRSSLASRVKVTAIEKRVSVTRHQPLQQCHRSRSAGLQ